MDWKLIWFATIVAESRIGIPMMGNHNVSDCERKLKIFKSLTFWKIYLAQPLEVYLFWFYA